MSAVQSESKSTAPSAATPHAAAAVAMVQVADRDAGDAPPAGSQSRSRRAIGRALMLVGVVVVAVGGGTAYLLGGRYVGTDDAYVKAAQLTVTTDVSGVVKSVDVREGQRVAAGEVLFRLDAEPFEIAVATAEASLLQAELTVKSLKADYQRAMQQVQAQQALVDVAQTTLGRFEKLAAQGALARTQWDEQQATYLSALATVNSLQQAAAVTLARLNGNPSLPVERFPDVMKARAALAEAKRQLEHTVVRAPFAGVVTAVSSLQPGTLIVSAMSAFSTTSAVGLVADHDLWIEAHMKETDLTRVVSGQAVDIHIDTYPECHWRGSVEAIAPASGAAFSALPAQNFSGNWVKVVQRIPVRISLEDGDCDARLSSGMSAVVDIDTGYRRWRTYWSE